MINKRSNILFILLLIVSLSFIGAETLSVQQASVNFVGGSSSGGSSWVSSFLEATTTQSYVIKTEEFSKELFAKSYVENTEEPDSPEIQAKNYIKNNPEITELTIEAIIDTIEESPELLVELLESNAKIGIVKMSFSEDTKNPFIDEVSGKVNNQLVKEGEIKAVNLNQESIGIQNRLINYLLNNLITSASINIEMITDSKDRLSIKFIATSAGWFSTEINTDYGALGQVGEGWFTWPWKYGEFTAYFTGSRHSQGYHYIIVYPIIWEDIFGEDLSKWPTWVLAIYVRGFVINVNDKSSAIIVKPIVENNAIIKPIVIPNVTLATGHAIQIKDYTLKPIIVEKPKLLKIIPIPWAKPQAEISISDGNKITTQIVKQNSEFKLGEIKVSVGEIKDNQVKFNMEE